MRNANYTSDAILKNFVRFTYGYKQIREHTSYNTVQPLTTMARKYNICMHNLSVHIIHTVIYSNLLIERGKFYRKIFNIIVDTSVIRLYYRGSF